MDPVAVIFWGLIIIGVLLYGVSWWKIFSKAGRHGALGLLMYLPVVNFIVLLYLAFSKWPARGQLQGAMSAEGSQ